MNPVSLAKWVMETHEILGIPAQSLHDIANKENIGYRYGDYPDLWDGMLLSKGEKKAILINTHNSNFGKQNFTFAHELGHYFFRHTPPYSTDGRIGFRCIGVGSEKERATIEVEANRFAVELLMPEDQFRLDMAGSPIDFSLIYSLSKKYQVSKHAASNRILDFVQTPCIIIRTHGLSIQSIKSTPSAKQYARGLAQIPIGTFANKAITQNLHQSNFEESDPVKWFSQDLAAGQLYECTKGNPSSGYFMIILRW